MAHYIVAAVGDWNRLAFERHADELPGDWRLVETPEALRSALSAQRPDIIFFPHWRWKIEAAIFDNFTCIGFHMTDLPYGRGGSPLQNLILRGHRTTVVSAFQIGEEMDAGPVYCKEPLSLHGSAADIFERCARVCWKSIGRILDEQPVPVAQQGDVVHFERRTPQQSRIPDNLDPTQLHDFIRMLDAPGYPHAFIEHAGYRIEFTRSELGDGTIQTQANITPIDQS